MKITFSNNASPIGLGVETNRDEIGGKNDLENLAENFSDSMTRAYDAAKMVWDKYPEFRQITLDTMTDEDRQIIEEMEKKGGERC